MYPEGWLISPEGKLLLLFQKDQVSKTAIGSIKKWESNNGSPSLFISSEKASSLEAITKWIELTEKGWRRVDTKFDVEAA
tara:strand:+ start:2807 stop:3046 length:240 start_codon:yes stop_codon:yes gene_type:complete